MHSVIYDLERRIHRENGPRHGQRSMTIQVRKDLELGMTPTIMRGFMWAIDTLILLVISRCFHLAMDLAIQNLK